MARYAETVLISTFALVLMCVSLTDSTFHHSHLSISGGSTIGSDICSPPFVQLGKKCIYIEQKKRVNWFEAAHICRTMKAKLASVECEEEKNILKDYMERNIRNHHYWLSGNDLGKENEFRWLNTGEIISNYFWLRNQPDDYGRNEDCIELRFRKNNFFFMNDFNCRLKNFFLCEADVSTVELRLW